MILTSILLFLFLTAALSKNNEYILFHIDKIPELIKNGKEIWNNGNDMILFAFWNNIYLKQIKAMEIGRSGLVSQI